MSGYYKGGFSKLRANVAGQIRLRSLLPPSSTVEGPPPVVEGPPVVGGFYVSPTGNDLANGAIETPFGKSWPRDYRNTIRGRKADFHEGWSSPTRIQNLPHIN